MYSREHRPSQPFTDSDSPTTNQFAPRRFVVQPKTEEVKPQQNQTLDLETKEEQAKQYRSAFYDSAIFTRRPTLARTPQVQMKLTIGQAGNQYEQGTDRVASNLVQRINAPESQGVQRMKMGSDEEVPFYRGGSEFKAKQNEVKIDEKGFVKPTHGISVHLNAEKMQRFGGAYKISNLPETLKIIQRGKDKEHYEIVPKESGKLTFEDFNAELSKIGAVKEQ